MRAWAAARTPRPRTSMRATTSRSASAAPRGSSRPWACEAPPPGGRLHPPPAVEPFAPPEARPAVRAGAGSASRCVWGGSPPARFTHGKNLEIRELNETVLQPLIVCFGSHLPETSSEECFFLNICTYAHRYCIVCCL